MPHNHNHRDNQLHSLVAKLNVTDPIVYLIQKGSQEHKPNNEGQFIDIRRTELI